MDQVIQISTPQLMLLNIARRMRACVSLVISVFAFTQSPAGQCFTTNNLTPPLVETSLSFEAGNQVLNIVLINQSDKTLLLPRDLSSFLRWKAYYYRKTEEGFEAEDIILPYPDEFARLRTDGPSAVSIAKEKIESLLTSISELAAIPHGDKFELKVPLANIVNELNIPLKEGFTIMLQPRFSDILLFNDVPEDVRERMFQTKLYGDRIYLDGGQWIFL